MYPILFRVCFGVTCLYSSPDNPLLSIIWLVLQNVFVSRISHEFEGKKPLRFKSLGYWGMEIDAVYSANIQSAQLPSPSFVATLGQLFCQILSYSRRSNIFNFYLNCMSKTHLLASC